MCCGGVARPRIPGLSKQKPRKKPNGACQIYGPAPSPCVGLCARPPALWFPVAKPAGSSVSLV